MKENSEKIINQIINNHSKEPSLRLPIIATESFASKCRTISEETGESMDVVVNEVMLQGLRLMEMFTLCKSDVVLTKKTSGSFEMKGYKLKQNSTP